MAVACTAVKHRFYVARDLTGFDGASRRNGAPVFCGTIISSAVQRPARCNHWEPGADQETDSVIQRFWAAGGQRDAYRQRNRGVNLAIGTVAPRGLRFAGSGCFKPSPRPCAARAEQVVAEPMPAVV